MLQVRSPGYIFIQVNGNIFDHLEKNRKYLKGSKSSKSRGKGEERLFKSLELDGSSENFVLFNAPDFAVPLKKHSYRDIWGEFSGSLLATNPDFSPKMNDFVMAGQLLTTGSLDVKDSVFLCGLFAADTACRA